MTHKDETVLCNTIKANGWEQGSLFLSSPSDLGIDRSKKKALYLLVTHSCDILHSPFKDEPYAEAILAKAISDAKGHLTHGKNPRKIHVELHEQKEVKWYEFSTSNRVFFDRKKLTGFKPSPNYQITEKMLRNLISWLSKKYDRAAFPDAFNNRLGECKIIEKLKDILKKKGRDIKGLYIRLDSSKELADDAAYKIFLYMLISDDGKNSNINFDDVLEKIVEKIECGTKIHVDRYNVLTLDDMTARDMATMQYWDFDYLSYREKPGGDIIKRR